MNRLIRSILKSLIRIYHNSISPYNLQCCRFYPSCSCYAIEAIERYGSFKGLALCAWRILRCNPFSSGGYDPVK